MIHRMQRLLAYPLARSDRETRSAQRLGVDQEQKAELVRALFEHAIPARVTSSE
jgi:hypothetical protein